MLDPAQARELASRAKAGDAAAFDELVRRCDRDVVELAGRLLADRTDAEDVRQLAWLRVWQGLADFDERARFTTWAFRIVVNLCRDKQRERARREARAESGFDAERLLARDPRPDEALAREETAARVRHALATLSEDERECLVLRHFHGLPAAEIGVIVGSPRTTVQSRLARALARLELRLRPLLADERSAAAAVAAPRAHAGVAAPRTGAAVAAPRTGAAVAAPLDRGTS